MAYERLLDARGARGQELPGARPADLQIGSDVPGGGRLPRGDRHDGEEAGGHVEVAADAGEPLAGGEHIEGRMQRRPVHRPREQLLEPLQGAAHRYELSVPDRRVRDVGENGAQHEREGAVRVVHRPPVRGSGLTGPAVHREFPDAFGPNGHRVPLAWPQQVVGGGVHEVVAAFVPTGHLLVGGRHLDQFHVEAGLPEVPGVQRVVEVHVPGAGEDRDGQLLARPAGAARAEGGQRGNRGGTGQRAHHRPTAGSSLVRM